MDEHIRLVKRQIAWLSGQISRYAPGQPRFRADMVAMYERLLVEHQNLLSFLEGLQTGGPTSARRADADSVTDTHSNGTDDLSDLPEELLKELSGTSKADADPLVQIINDHGGSATLDQILIGLYRKYGQIGKRTITANRLYRLSKRGFVWVLPGKKGIYATKPPDQEQEMNPQTSLFSRHSPTAEGATR
jgi:hypothetical protein